MQRSCSRLSMKRSESAPTLAPLWEPEQEEDHDAQPLFTSSVTGTSDLAPASTRRPALDGLLPTLWRRVLSTLSALSGDGLSSLQQAELIDAAKDSLRPETLPLRFQAGLVDQRYVFKRELVVGQDFKVMEGVQRQTQKNYSLKVVTSSMGGLRAGKGKVMDPMTAFHMIRSFVDEVYCHPSYVCICMKWGMHEVDASHQLARWIIESVRLLRELLPAGHSQARYLRLSATELQHVLLRTACLDTYLQSNLFLY